MEKTPLKQHFFEKPQIHKYKTDIPLLDKMFSPVLTISNVHTFLVVETTRSMGIYFYFYTKYLFEKTP